MPTPIKVAANIDEIVQHADGLRSYVIVPHRKVPAFTPGQFLHLALDPYESGIHWPDSRPFSMASSPAVRDRLRITISRQGYFTSRMFAELQVGSQVWLKLPYGTFCPNPELPGRLVMIAGGSGITPFMSFIQWAVEHRPHVAIDLHYGARSSNLLTYRSSIQSCIERGLFEMQVRYYVEQMHEQPQGQPLPLIGRLSAKDIWHGLEYPESARFYLSGPKEMIDSFRHDLFELGAGPSNVLSDDWA